MKKKLIGFNYNGKKINIEVSLVPWWYEGIGLMFTKKETADAIMFSSTFPRRWSIFSKFIPYNFLAVWIDKYEKVIQIKIVRPGEKGIKPSRKFIKLIEIPINDKYDGVIRALVGKRKL